MIQPVRMRLVLVFRLFRVDRFMGLDWITCPRILFVGLASFISLLWYIRLLLMLFFIQLFPSLAFAFSSFLYAGIEAITISLGQHIYEYLLWFFFRAIICKLLIIVWLDCNHHLLQTNSFKNIFLAFINY